jgi:serine/threonine protein kinase
MGGTATVYEAVDRMGRRFAIKVLHPELASHRVARKRFQSEGYAANRVGHPNAVAILDDGVDHDGTVYLVMELLDGHSLAKPLNEGRALPVRVVAMVALGVLDVLAAAHDHGIVHRDVKPGNIFSMRDGQIKLVDFGAAHIGERVGVSVITQAGTAVGTPEFMAPEQAAGREVDALTDIWAVGATMFQLLSQRLVHEVDSARGAVITAATRPARPVRSVAPHVPVEVARVVDRALSFNRAERWPNARAMRQALLAACPELHNPATSLALGSETEPEASRRVGQIARSFVPASPTRSGYVVSRRSQRRWVWFALGFVALGVAALGAWYWQRSAHAPPAVSSQELDRTRQHWVDGACVVLHEQAPVLV